MKIRSTRDLAAAVRGRRKDLGLSQAELAGQVGVSRAWINEIEAGKPSVEFGLVLRLLDVLGLHLDLVKGDTRGGDAYVGRSIDLDSLIDEYRQR